MKKIRRVSPQLEQLSERIVPNVDFPNVTNVNGALFIPTDGTATDVTITWTSPTDVTVTDNTAATSNAYSGVTKSLTYQNTNAGVSDAVLVNTGGFAVPASHSINTGDVADRVEFSGGGSVGKISASLGDGADNFYLNTSGAGAVTGEVNVNTGGGADSVTIKDSDISGNLTVSNPAGSDFIETRDNNVGGAVNGTLGGDGSYFHLHGVTTGGDVTVTATGGNNDIRVTDGSTITHSHVSGNVSMTAGSGDDRMFVNFTDVTGSVVESAGDGDNTMYVQYDSMVSGSVTMTAGSGDDHATLDDGAEVGASVTIKLGDGNNHINNLNEDLTIHGSLVITTGSGDDDIEISYTQVTGSLSINAGEGNNTLYLGGLYGAGPVAVKGSVTITSGSGADTFKVNTSGDGVTTGAMSVNLGGGANVWDLDQDFTVNGNLSLTAGSGADSLTLFATTAGKVKSNLTVNLGDGANTFVFQGSVGSGSTGTLSYSGGAGVDRVTVNGFVAKQLTASLGAGDDSFKYGALFATTSASAFIGLVDGGTGTDTYDATLLPASIRATINSKTSRLHFETVML